MRGRLMGLIGLLGCGGATAATSGMDAGRASPDAQQAACQPVNVSDAGPTSAAACMPPEAGACHPGTVASAQLAWVPPRAHQSLCTTSQIAAFYSACTTPGGSTPTACSAYENDPANVPCFACITSIPSDPAYGALIVDTQTSSAFINVAGCIATLDPCNAPCAHVTLEKQQCLGASCSVCSTLGSDNQCTEEAAGCPCGQYAAAVTACWSELLDAASPATPCLASGFQASFTATAGALCLVQ